MKVLIKNSVELTDEIERRFWSKVIKTNYHYIWSDAPVIANDSGIEYGRLHVSSTPNVEVYAHILSWMIHHKKQVPDGMKVLHHCDLGMCVRPKHLYIGTAMDNAHDREVRGRIHHPSGEEKSQAILTWEKVRTIRQLYSDKLATQQNLADVFGVSFQLISMIVNNKRWIE
jgi:hypothetical protein